MRSRRLLAFFLLLIIAVLWWWMNRVVVIRPTPRLDAETLIADNEEAELSVDRPPFALPATSAPLPASWRWRIGVGIPDADAQLFNWPETRPGWYLNWTANLEYEVQWWGLWTSVWMRPADPRLGMEFAPMVRVPNGQLWPNEGVLRKLARQNPGLTWLIGNEPDVKWQDNATPAEYVAAYYRAYRDIKRGDPSAQIAIAGLSQITPLRLRYLDEIWQLYQEQYGEPMPVDVWNMHAFVLPEKRRAWGVEIPPGIDDVQQGAQWDVKDHNDLRLVEGQVRLMRQWMFDHGQQEKPLLITEYGILMPASLGFPPSVVIEFMEGSFALFDSLRDPALGQPSDEQRLVQRWVWFSSYYNKYPAGNLFNSRGRANPQLRALTRLIDSE